jgi:anaerobic selenocysteine-containing dehydrogenase
LPGRTQWCAIEVFVQDGRAVRVRGNQNSKTNHGYVCPRGHLIPQQLYDPDCIKVPMKRANPVKGRGVDPKWVPISWDEALDTAAEKMFELRRGNETHKLVYMRGRYSSTPTDLRYTSHYPKCSARRTAMGQTQAIDPGAVQQPGGDDRVPARGVGPQPGRAEMHAVLSAALHAAEPEHYR